MDVRTDSERGGAESVKNDGGRGDAEIRRQELRVEISQNWGCGMRIADC